MSFTKFVEKEEETEKIGDLIFEEDHSKKTKLNRRGSELLEKLNKIDVKTLRDINDGSAKNLSSLRKIGGEKRVGNGKWSMIKILIWSFYRYFV